MNTDSPEQVILYRTISTVVYYDESERGPTVPYGPVEHDDGHVNHGYIHLKGRPPKAKEISEAVGKPDLIALLEYCARTESPYVTLGCENELFPVADPSDDGPQVYIGSYINIAFAELDANRRSIIHATAIELADELGDLRRNWVCYEIGEQQCYLFGKPSWCLMAKCSGHGFDEAMAQQNMGIWLQAIVIGTEAHRW